MLVQKGKRRSCAIGKWQGSAGRGPMLPEMKDQELIQLYARICEALAAGRLPELSDRGALQRAFVAGAVRPLIALRSAALSSDMTPIAGLTSPSRRTARSGVMCHL